jgi:hypothetical protein
MAYSSEIAISWRPLRWRLLFLSPGRQPDAVAGTPWDHVRLNASAVRGAA